MILMYLVGLLLLILFLWAYKKNNHWKDQNIPYLPTNSIFGNLKEYFLMKRCLTDVLSEIYYSKDLKDLSFYGIRIFHMPTIFVKDPALIKNILVKDFHNFCDRLASSDAKCDPVGNSNPFLMKNPDWKRMRTKLTHVFSSAKMKNGFHLINDIGIELNDMLLSNHLDSKTNSFLLEMKVIAARYTTDTVASVAFGMHGNSIKDPNSHFHKFARKIFEISASRIVELGSCFFVPQLVSLFRFKFFSQETVNFMRESINQAIDTREKNEVIRGDLIDALVSLKSMDKDKVPGMGKMLFQGDVLIGQAATFLAAGFETTSSVISFGMFELAKSPVCQKRLKKEINVMFDKNNGQLTYEAVKNMEYLEMVFQEISRLHPSLPYIERMCVEDYSMEPFSDCVIKKGTPVIIPSCTIQRDAEYFPNPNKFDPERFSQENKKNINPYTTMSFGAGPRKCIGESLGILQSKIGIIYLLKNHFYSLAENTSEDLVYEPKAVLLASIDGINLSVFRDPGFKN